MTGEGKAVSFLTLKNINENHFWSPKALAYRRKTYPPRACHLTVTARPSQREGGFFGSQSPAKSREEPLGSSSNLVANIWFQIELATVEQNSGAVVFEGPKSSCC